MGVIVIRPGSMGYLEFWRGVRTPGDNTGANGGIGHRVLLLVMDGGSVRCLPLPDASRRPDPATWEKRRANHDDMICQGRKQVE